ncbi:MAG TPA: type II toxin-antitoxin system YafQ family toxin [Candidatus Paceibacterota bacterium]|nr:type II toxin-antitoxin system YafQ family toxin [Candidatus Paceibacterota bacterium]HMO82804.1 type II toxin-antitoxin system YafQ family toxin [Candidatus Paceibacterota bacterium]
MYRVWYSKKFSKSFARLVKGGLKKSTQQKITLTIKKLASAEKLDEGYRDHQLHGALAIYRECHIQGDLLLVYQIIDKELVLLLIDVGSHNDIFG